MTSCLQCKEIMGSNGPKKFPYKDVSQNAFEMEITLEPPSPNMGPEYFGAQMVPKMRATCTSY